jgi:ferredoxin
LAVTVDHRLMADIKKMGAFDVSACYNCGTCTAICPLSEEGHELPRMLIRYAALGIKEKLLASPEVWLCYFCGECSTSCPKTADPGQFMMAARRYVIRKYSLGRIADAFYSSRLLSTLAFLIFPALILGIFAADHGPIITSEVDMWSFIPMDLIHELGLVVMAFIGLTVLGNLAIMYRNLSAGTDLDRLKSIPLAKRIGIWIRTAFTKVAPEIIVQKRFVKCDENSVQQKRTATSKYLAHMALFWGFLGLAVATVLDYGINEYALALSRDVPRVIGIVAGIAMMYGATYYIYKRLKKGEVFSAFTHFTDWAFLILLFFGGLTGFLLDVFMYAGLALATYATLVVHLMFAFDLLITLPFTKFAHALYRPFALWIVGSRDTISKQIS